MTTEKLDVAETVRRVIADEAGKKRDEITDETTLDALAFDSLDRVELAMSLEHELEKDDEIPNGDIDRWVTVGDVVKYLAP